MIKRLAFALLLALTVAAPLHADFSSLARAVSSRPGVKRMYIPFLGIARMAVWMASPEGVHDFQLATFKGGALDDGLHFAQLMQQHARGYTPLVQVRERNGHFTFIYARPGKGDRLELMVFAHDSETVLVRVEIDAERLARTINSPSSIVKIARR